MHDHAPILDGRVRRHLAEKIRPAVTDTTEGPNSRPGVRGQGEPISISEGLSLSYEPFRVGDKWGPPWGTTWLHLMATVPPEHRDDHLEMIVDLGGVWDSPGFQSEGLVVRPDGSVIKALNPRNTWIPVEIDTEGHIDIYVEAASNPILLAQPPFQPTEDGDKLTASTDAYYTLKRAGFPATGGFRAPVGDPSCSGSFHGQNRSLRRCLHSISCSGRVGPSPRSSCPRLCPDDDGHRPCPH